MKKRFLSLLLMLCMAVSLVPITASAENIQYVVAGSDSLFGTMWDFTSESGNIMTEKNGKYELLLSPAEACGTVLFQVAKLTNGVVASDSDYYGNAAGGNIEINVSGGGEILIVFDPSTREITVSGDNVTINDNKLQIDSIRTVGSGAGNWLNGANWDLKDDANLMTETSTGVYEITYNDIDAYDDYKFKFVANGNWTDSWGGSIDSEDAVYDGNNIIFDVKQDNSTVKLVIDLTKFDNSTKNGAIYKIYVNNVQINGSKAQTATAAKNITLGSYALSKYNSAAEYAYVYYGTYENNPIKWRILDRAYQYNANDTSKTGMLLLSENTLGTTKFGEDYMWSTSTARNWCSNLYNSSFGTGDKVKEKDFILETTSYDRELYNDSLFFLSYYDAYNGVYFKDEGARKATDLNGNSTLWWLRTACDYESVCCIDEYGNFGEAYVGSEPAPAARPAFNLNSESILFTSSAKDGKKTNSLISMEKNTNYEGNEYKLTLKDSTRNKFDIKVTELNEGFITFSYENAKVGENEYISAIIVNALGDVTHYGKLENVTTESGRTSVSLSGLNLASTDKVYIFNEQANGDYKTDFASELKEISSEIDLENDGVSVYLTDNNTATLIVASYKDDELKDIKTIPIEAGMDDYDFANIGLNTNGADSIKAFLWKDMTSLISLCEAKEVKPGQ